MSFSNTFSATVLSAAKVVVISGATILSACIPGEPGNSTQTETSTTRITSHCFLGAQQAHNEFNGTEVSEEAMTISKTCKVEYDK